MRDTAEKVFYGSWCRIVNGVVIRKYPATCSAKCWRFSRTFVRDFGLHISFTSRIAPHKEVNSSHFRKHWEIRVFMKRSKREVTMWQIQEKAKKIVGRRFGEAKRLTMLFGVFALRNEFVGVRLTDSFCLVRSWGEFSCLSFWKNWAGKKSFLCLSCLKNRAEIKHSLLVLLEK